jgi:hypothetical protein
MKKIFACLLVFYLLFSCSYAVRVKGYYKSSSGTYVMPHHRTAPDSSKWNNYSTKGNVNPYTGKRGIKNAY